MALEAEGDHWVLPCEGLVVGQIRIDYAYGLEFTETPEAAAEVAWQLRVGAEFLFTDPLGRSLRINPEGEAAAVGPALVTRHQQLTDGDIWSNGRIRMTFANGCIVEVGPHERYEAWTLASSRGRRNELFVCTPGGGHVDWGR
jgi:Family of unknown function (DUF6188)